MDDLTKIIMSIFFSFLLLSQVPNTGNPPIPTLFRFQLQGHLNPKSKNEVALVHRRIHIDRSRNDSIRLQRSLVRSPLSLSLSSQLKEKFDTLETGVSNLEPVISTDSTSHEDEINLN
ncbi:uncharacterized protein LOC130782818 isoform X1 [Actinidia eriantha]|uniref:uncharacterized protein LOC130782818 isoform X1 n=1 Tax=Actinidia eriantha TaxID=165200 RepID=UPI00258FCFA7|nr:uncharacterized protein LOC130782818 isoform X1 [Actinidia eriantha]